jgi:hypothetical protein
MPAGEKVFCFVISEDFTLGEIYDFISTHHTQEYNTDD